MIHSVTLCENRTIEFAWLQRLSQSLISLWLRLADVEMRKDLMNTLIAFCKELRLGRAFAILTAAFLLFLNIACSNSDLAGARPNNPPVQMGGQNNPYKAGGDGYNEYKMSTDPAVVKRDRASASSPGQTLAKASKTVKQSLSERSSQTMGAAPKISGNAMQAAQQTPEQPQAVIDRSNPDVKILEKVGDTFKEASKHLTGSTEESIERSGIAQPN